MPLYEYQCDSCGRRFERIQKFSDPPIAECPDCGAPVRKLLSSPAIQFKGSGFYITDYARSGKSDGDGAGKAGASKAGGESTGKTDKADAPGEASKGESTATGSSGSSSGGSKDTAAKPAGGTKAD